MTRSWFPPLILAGSVVVHGCNREQGEPTTPGPSAMSSQPLGTATEEGTGAALAPEPEPVENSRSAAVELPETAEVIAGDPRNANIEISAYAVGQGGLVIDLSSVPADKSRADVFRVLLQLAQRLQDRGFDDVVLAYRGEPRFMIDGAYFAEIGRSAATENPIYLMRTFPSRLRRLDGTFAFAAPAGPVLQGLSEELAAFAAAHDEWYLGDELSRLQSALPAAGTVAAPTSPSGPSIAGEMPEGTGQAPVDPLSRYDVALSTDPMTDATQVIVSLQAEESQVTYYGGEVRPTLAVRCADSDTNVYVAFGFHVDGDYRGNVRARIRYDGGEPERLTLSESTTRTAAFFPRPLNHLREMFRHTEMLIEVEESLGGSRVARFNIEGLEAATAPIREHCNWTVEP